VTDPFRITGPAVVSFSGGRTSGYMLWRILQAHGGTLPADVKVVFCNTGKERPETLDFVERCSCEWGVPVVWLEYRYEGAAMPPPTGDGVKRKTPGKHTFAVVDYATAARNGEPLEAIITARNMLPNVVMRFCTVECKIRTTQRYLKSIGWKHWTNCIGFRADEPQRVARLRGSNKHTNEDPVAPLHAAGVTKADVADWWGRQSFRLSLRDHEGNCDLCFLKGRGKLETIMRDRPDLADWWVRMEAAAVRRGLTREPSVAFFRKDRPRYAALLELSKRPQLPGTEDEPDELSIACHCTD
jgi:3'-phosphoadenosine 5'-phosphosulfate sulfotransferase (PAPS reductase)/FAD synthetase